MKRKVKKRFHEFDVDNDIKYKAPLSYRHLRIIAWVCIILAQIGFVLSVFGKMDSYVAEKTGVLSNILSAFSPFMMPLFLIATFSTILNNSKSFKYLLTLYGGTSIGVYLVFLLFHERYLVGSISALFSVSREEARVTLDVLIQLAVYSKGYIAFNIFIDLFMCTLFAYFVLYKPKTKLFAGKKIYIFRYLAILPISYEITCFIIKLLAALNKISVSPFIYPALTTKPPMTFIIFVLIVAFIKIRERLFIKKGKEKEDYDLFVTTKANSWHVSKLLATCLFVGGIVDLVLFIIFSFAGALPNLEPDMSNVAEAMEESMRVLTRVDIGQSTTLIFIAPLMYLYSYTKTHKKNNIDVLIPVIAIIVIVFVYIEAGYLSITYLGEELRNFINSIGSAS